MQLRVLGMSRAEKQAMTHAIMSAGHEHGRKIGDDSCITCEAGDEFHMFWRRFSFIFIKNMEEIVLISILLESGCMSFASEI